MKNKLSITITEQDLPTLEPAQIWIELNGIKVLVVIGEHYSNITTWRNKAKYAKPATRCSYKY